MGGKNKVDVTFKTTYPIVFHGSIIPIFVKISFEYNYSRSH